METIEAVYLVEMWVSTRAVMTVGLTASSRAVTMVDSSVAIEVAMTVGEWAG